MLKESNNTTKEKISLSIIQKYLLFAMLFILPLAIFPFPWDWTEKGMSLVILIFSTIIVGIEIVKLIWEGKSTLIKSIIDGGSFAILLSLILSSLLSKDAYTSMWGIDNRLGSGLVIFVAILLVSFSARTFIKNISDVKRAIFAFLSGMFLTNILSIFSFLGVNVWGVLPVYKDLHQAGLPMFRSSKVHILINIVSILLSTGIIGEFILGKGHRKTALTFGSIFLIFSVINIWLFSINQGISLLILFLLMLILLWIFGISKMKAEKSKKKDFLILFLSIILTIGIPVVLLQIPSLKSIIIPKSINLVAQVSLGADISWVIAASVVVASLWKGLFGLGVDTYTIAYNLYKPLNTNLISFNDVNFYFAGNEIFTKFSNGGLLWLIAFGFFGFLIFKLVRNDLKKLKQYQGESVSFWLIILDFVIVFIFLASIFVSYTILISVILLLLISFHAVLKDSLSGGSSDKFVFKLWAVNLSSAIESGKAMYNINVFLTVIVVLLFSGLTVLWGSKVVSSVYLLKAESYFVEQNSLYKDNTNPTTEQRESFVKDMAKYYSNAVKFDSKDPLASRKLGLMYLEEVGIAAEKYAKTKGEDGADSLINDVGQWKNYAIDYTRKSVDISPSVYANWEGRARVYMGLVGMGFYDYTTDAVYSLGKAIELNPLNFELYYSKAQISLINGDKDSALSALTQVLGINPTHIPSILLAGEINKEKGNLAVYESYLKAAKKVLETQGNTDTDVYKQVTSQLNEFTKEDTTKSEKKEADVVGEENTN